MIYASIIRPNGDNVNLLNVNHFFCSYNIITILSGRAKLPLFHLEVYPMSDRINTPYTSDHFVAFCLSMLGQPYW